MFTKHSYLILISFSLFINCELQWGQWTPGVCQRNCSEPYGQIKFTRECKSCATINNCELVNITNCIGQLSQLSEKYSKCYDANTCYGEGLYTGDWGDWVKRSECILAIGTQCIKNSMNQGVQKFSRSCLASNKSIELASIFKIQGKESYKPKCSGDMYTDIKYVICPVNIFFYL